MAHPTPLHNRAHWPSRHDTLTQALADPALHAVVQHLTIRSSAKSQDPPPLEVALAAYWVASQRKRIPHPLRQALPALQLVANANLATADFPSVTSLQRSSAAYVEIVRAKFDRQLYVLKTVVKGTAKRESNRCSPVIEATLLSRAQEAHPSRRHIPALLAAFQSQNSLHIAMQYFPAGDLDQLLHSAGEAGLGRSVGGLLDETYVKSYATDIVAAVGWCHDQGYAHRDVKPANFLLDRSGHLKLCDFATAAPFSTFGAASSSTARSLPRRRIHHFYSCLAGTPDYIAPDILLAEEERLNSIATRSTNANPWSRIGLSSAGVTPDDSSNASAFTAASCSRNHALHAFKQPDPDSEGAYGPEVDWWSVGIVVYEMVFKNVPFWAETIREAHHRIRNHEQYLQIPNTAPVSRELKSLIRALLARRQVRLGASLDGTAQVMAHPFFAGTDWENCLDAPAPFIPNVPGAGAAAAAADIIEEEPSILHSPRPGAAAHTAPIDESYSMTPESLHLSQIYQGDLGDFPAFMDSRDEEELAARKEAQTAAVTAAARHTRAASEPTSPSEPMSSSSASHSRSADWAADVDLAWVGFSALPAPDAFGTLDTDKQRPHPHSQIQPLSIPAFSTPAPAAARTRAASVVVVDWSPASSSSLAPSPDAWGKFDAQDDEEAHAGPIASTPYGRRAASSSSPSTRAMPTPLPAMSTPFATAPKSLQRQAIAQASRMASTPATGRFVTPLRKTSMPDMASVSRSAPSPYPFPVAARATPGTADRQRLISLSVRRGQQQPPRAASQSPWSQAAVGTSGSESRCSGGSNAKRDMSEQEAMHELTNAVLQSARKVRIDHQEVNIHRRLTALEEQVELTLGGATTLGGDYSVASASRPHIPHSRTDSNLLRLRPAQQEASQRGLKMPRSDSTPSLSGVAPSSTPKLGPLLAIRDRDQRPRSVTEGQLQGLKPPSRPSSASGHSSSLFSRRMLSGKQTTQQAPLLNLPAPVPTSAPMAGLATPGSESEPDSPLLSRPGTSHGYVGRLSRKSSSSLLTAAAPVASTSVSPPLSPSSASSDATKVGSNNSAANGNKLLRPLAPTLRKRRSDRQLKLDAQQKTTPTRLNKVQSPLLTTSFAVAPQEGDGSVAGASSSASSASSGRSTAGDSCPSLVEDGSSDSGSSSSGGESDTLALPRLPTSRLSAPPMLGRSLQGRSRSYGQLPKVRLGPTPEDGTVKLGFIQEEERPAAVQPSAARTIRRKDSREMLSEYRLACSPTLPDFPQDAFGPGMFAAVPTIVDSTSSKGRRRPASMANLRKAFANAQINEGEEEGSAGSAATRHRKYSTEGSAGGMGRTRRTSSSSAGSTGSADKKDAVVVAPTVNEKKSRSSLRSEKRKSGTAVEGQATTRASTTRHSLFSFRPQQLSSVQESSAAAAAPLSSTTVSPLGKMDHRLVGLQGSVESLQSRIERIKRSLNGAAS